MKSIQLDDLEKYLAFFIAEQKEEFAKEAYFLHVIEKQRVGIKMFIQWLEEKLNSTTKEGDN